MMRLFVLRENIKRYRNLLEREQADDTRKTLLNLLAESEAELADLEEAYTHRFSRNDNVVKTVAEMTLDDALKVQHAQFGSLHFHDAVAGALVIMTQRNLPLAFLDRFSSVSAEDGSSYGRCLATGNGVRIEDVMEDPLFEPHRDIARSTGFRAMQSTPLRDGRGNLLVVLTTLFAAVHRFTAGERAAMDREAGRLAPTFDRLLSNARAALH
jgi:hypothetical protein